MPLYKVSHQTHLENCSSQPYSRKEIEMRRATYKRNKEHQENGELVLGGDSCRRAQLGCMSKIKIEKGYDYCLGIHYKGSS